MNKSANQLYRASKSPLGFKEWLHNEQQNGALIDHEKMFNADGEELEDEIVIKKPTIKKAKSNLMRSNMIGIAALGLIIYGLTQYSSQASE